MAQICIRGGRECDGCMDCYGDVLVVGQCDECGEDIHEGEVHYNIKGTMIHEDCLLDWMSQFKAKEA